MDEKQVLMTDLLYLLDSNMNSIQDTLRDLKLKIIEFVRDCPALYDAAHPQYKDPVAKDQLFEDIGVQIGCQGSVVKSLFNGLKKEYSNQRCLYESRLQNGDPANIPEPTWIFWKPLSFLREKMAKRKRIPRSIPASFASKIASSSIITSGVPILPKPPPAQYVQVPVNPLPATNKCGKEMEIDVTKFLVIQTGEIQTPEISIKSEAITSPLPEENGMDSSQSEDTHQQWQQSSGEHNIEEQEESPSVSQEIPRKRKKYSESLSDLTETIRAAVLKNNNNLCRHPDTCSLGHYVSAQLQLFPKNVQIDLEEEILQLIMSKKKQLFCGKSKDDTNGINNEEEEEEEEDN